VRRRPDARSAWNEVLAADRRVAAAVADRFPVLTLSAGAETSAEATRDLFSGFVASIAAGLVAPILDGGARAAEVDRARAAARVALDGYRQVVLDALEEVEAALVEERCQRERIESLESQLVLSRRSAEQIRREYANGTVDYLRVLDAIGSNQSLERTLLRARRQLVDARIELGRALAGGFEPPPPGTAALAGAR
jgi:outer membrane protein TolC